MKLLFCNVGWMENYQGLTSGDQISGGGSYVNEEGRGHEVCNFSPYKGKLYGYVQPRGKQIDIQRIGAGHDEDFIEGVTVVWTATRPTGGTAVIGWYSTATVFREYQKFRRTPQAQLKNGIDGYWVIGDETHARLLPVDARVLEIPRQVKGGMGQSNVWYADSKESEGIVKKIISFINGERVTRTAKSNRGKKQNQERKAMIEKAAIRTCCEHFEALGYEVESVEKENVGWDLEASSGKSKLRIEVKGLSSAVFSAELTPNEYQAFALKADDYRLAVVTNTLEGPALSICRYSAEQKCWIVEGEIEGQLDVLLKQSASIRCI